MTSTTGAWSSLFHGLPNRTPASHLYTEEAIQNEQVPPSPDSLFLFFVLVLFYLLPAILSSGFAFSYTHYAFLHTTCTS